MKVRGQTGCEIKTSEFRNPPPPPSAGENPPGSPTTTKPQFVCSAVAEETDTAIIEAARAKGRTDGRRKSPPSRLATRARVRPGRARVRLPRSDCPMARKGGAAGERMPTTFVLRKMFSSLPPSLPSPPPESSQVENRVSLPPSLPPDRLSIR